MKRAIVGMLIAAGLALAGCNGPSPQPSPTTSLSASASPSTTANASSTATELTPAEKDQQSAEEAVRRYWAVLDELAADSSKSLNMVATVARGQAADQARIELGTLQSQGLKQIGQSVVQSVAATPQDNATYSVVTCVDLTGVNVVDSSGKSAIRPGRPDRQKYTYTVEKAPEGFFVTVDTLKGTPC